MASSSRRHCPSWADFQPELVAVVLGRLPLADRVRLAAVCRPWRRAARQERLPLPLPWLILPDGTFLSVPGGEIHRMPLPDDACCYGSIGNRLLVKRSTGELSLLDPFSKHAVVRIPEEAYPPPHSISVKPVLLSTLNRDLCLFPDSPIAMLITDSSLKSLISICQPGNAAAFGVPDGQLVSDVAFFDGKLYAISANKLFVIETGWGHKGNIAVVPSMKLIADAVDKPRLICREIAGKMHTCAYWSYLAESRGKLLHVKRLVGYLSTLKDDRVRNSRTISFEVFEADLMSTTNNPRVKWRRVHDLGGQALFVSTHSESRSLPASECGGQEDCIYFACDYDHGNCGPDPLRDCGVFDMRSGRITPLLLPDTVAVQRQGCKGRPAWFFPTKKV